MSFPENSNDFPPDIYSFPTDEEVAACKAYLSDLSPALADRVFQKPTPTPPPVPTRKELATDFIKIVVPRGVLVLGCAGLTAYLLFGTPRPAPGAPANTPQEHVAPHSHSETDR